MSVQFTRRGCACLAGGVPRDQPQLQFQIAGDSPFSGGVRSYALALGSMRIRRLQREEKESLAFPQQRAGFRRQNACPLPLKIGDDASEQLFFKIDF